MSPVEAAVEKPDTRSDAAASVRGGGSGGGGRIAPEPRTRIRSSLALSAADGSCELWDPAQPDGEALGATTSFAFPSETTIVLTFHE